MEEKDLEKEIQAKGLTAPAPAPRTSTPRLDAKSHGRMRWRSCGR